MVYVWGSAVCSVFEFSGLYACHRSACSLQAAVFRRERDLTSAAWLRPLRKSQASQESQGRLAVHFQLGCLRDPRIIRATKSSSEGSCKANSGSGGISARTRQSSKIVKVVSVVSPSPSQRPTQRPKTLQYKKKATSHATAWTCGGLQDRFYNRPSR